MTRKITVPTKYKEFIIVPHASGHDVVDPATGRWFYTTSQKRAKWWSSILTRAQNEFAGHGLRLVPEICEDHTP